MRARSVAVALGLVFFLVPQFAHSQGLPDIVWEASLVVQDGVAIPSIPAIP